MGDLSALDETRPDGTLETAANWDDRERETRLAIKTSFVVEHDLAGQHKFSIGNSAGRPATGHTNRIRWNTELGDMEYDNGADWIPFGFYNKRIIVATYVGDGTPAMSIINLGFQPGSVRIMPIAGGNSFTKTKHMLAVSSYREQDGVSVNTAIKSLDADGFTVGADLNVLNAVYSAICIRDL